MTLLVGFSDKKDIESLKHSALMISEHFHQETFGDLANASLF